MIKLDKNDIVSDLQEREEKLRKRMQESRLRTGERMSPAKKKARDEKNLKRLMSVLNGAISDTTNNDESKLMNMQDALAFEDMCYKRAIKFQENVKKRMMDDLAITVQREIEEQTAPRKAIECESEYKAKAEINEVISLEDTVEGPISEEGAKEGKSELEEVHSLMEDDKSSVDSVDLTLEEASTKIDKENIEQQTVEAADKMDSSKAEEVPVTEKQVPEEDVDNVAKDKVVCGNPICESNKTKLHRCSGCLKISYCSKQCSEGD